MEELKIAVRGAGDLATGVICRLTRAGYRVLALEHTAPSVIRRQAALAEALYEGSFQVEGLTARVIKNINEAESVWERGEVPVLADPEGSCLKDFRPDVLIDAIIAKKNLGTTKELAPFTVALGPGFEAGVDVDIVIETQRGHDLGRIIRQGSAAPNSGVPGLIAGYGAERVLHAPAAGRLSVVRDIGSVAEKGEVIARIKTKAGEENPVRATLTGLVRGMLKDGFEVKQGLKMADIDPRLSELKNCYTISDKARCIAGSVLEVVCAFERGLLDRQS